MQDFFSVCRRTFHGSDPRKKPCKPWRLKNSSVSKTGGMAPGFKKNLRSENNAFICSETMANSNQCGPRLGNVAHSHHCVAMIANKKLGEEHAGLKVRIMGWCFIHGPNYKPPYQK